ncbi:SEC-C metal-binding domain-containing protein [Chloroflexota bacterium]
MNNRQKVGRNDPCPCGSGKKYKKCCGAQLSTGMNKSQTENSIQFNCEIAYLGEIGPGNSI